MNDLVRAGLLLLLTLTVGCAEPFGTTPDPVAPVHVELDGAVTSAYTEFGLDLFARLRADAPQENLFVSPTSAALALTMTYNGASGETRDAMARALRIEGLEPAHVSQNASEWMAALTDTGDPRTELSIANSIWSRQGFPFHASFLEENRTAFDAEIRELPFDAAAVAQINDWVRRETKGKIDGIVDELSGDLVMVLINALYFKGEWQYRFDPENTRPRPFTRFDGTTVETPMMSQRVTLPYRHFEGVQMVALPYGDGRFSMVLALPGPDQSLDDFYASLDVERWGSWLSELRETDLDLVLPRFSIESDLSLNDPLSDLGMGIAFDRGAADFSRMSPEQLFISFVRQKTFVEVDEVGTEAAAATSVGMTVTSFPGRPLVHFDRPFFFAIHDGATETILFMGQLADPTE